MEAVLATLGKIVYGLSPSGIAVTPAAEKMETIDNKDKASIVVLVISDS